MIDYIRGEVAELTPAYAVLEAYGVGYKLQISLYTYSAVQGKKEARLYVYEAIREDAYLLFGFAGKQERELFELLLSVSGVGAGTARTILSAFAPEELARIIGREEAGLLKNVKGIGAKTAQRIIVDLKDKMAKTGLSGSSSGVEPASPLSQVQDEAVQALTMLGFAPAASLKVVAALLKEQPDAPVEQVIKWALKHL